MKQFWAIFAVCLALTQGSTVQPPTTKEHSVRATVTFHYVARTHHLLISTQHRELKQYRCYVVTLTDADRLAVHSDALMTTLEVRYLAMLPAARPTTKDQLDTHDLRPCGHASQNATIEYYTLDVTSLG